MSIFARWKGLLQAVLIPLCIAVPWWTFGAEIVENILRKNLNCWTLWVFPASYLIYFLWGRYRKGIFVAIAIASLISLFGPTVLRLLFEYDCIPAYCAGYVNNLFHIGCGEADAGCFIEGFVLFFVASLFAGAIFLVVKRYRSSL